MWYGVLMIEHSRSLVHSFTIETTPGMLQPLTCPCCGAPVQKTNSPCQHCGTNLVESNSSDRLEAEGNTHCPKCQAECFAGQNVCLKCHHIIQMSNKLKKTIEKVKFCQDKYRASFIPEVQKSFFPDEYVLADTYGVNEYYIVTTRRLLICHIEVKYGFFGGGRQTSKEPKRDLTYDRITKMTTWSELWYPNDNPMSDPALMNLQIETFDGDFDVCVVFSSEHGHLYKDPFYFEMCLNEAYHHHEEELPLYDQVLYLIDLPSTQESPMPEFAPAVPETPTPAEDKFRLKCRCGARIVASTKNIGKKGQCPKCSHTFVVPAGGRGRTP